MPSAVITIVISLAVGSLLYYFTHKTNSAVMVSKRELIIGSIISIIVLSIAGPLIERAIVNNKTTYYEYYNGYETAAIDTPIVCERDGQCSYTYRCDPYWTTETYTTVDSEGNTHTRTRPVRKYHSCPYVKIEHQYSVVTTLGTYDISGNFSDKSRQEWRNGSGFGDIPIGPPQIWVEAYNRVKSGNNGGVTKIHAYKNLLLASDKTILDTYSADIDNYKAKELLPDHTSNYDKPIYNYYLADKFSTAKVTTDNGSWNTYLSRLNGYFGKELQGDVHIAAIDASKVLSADNYSQALFAYWKSPHFKKYALPKNSIGIVVGVSGNTIQWARATGGLPVGNEALFNDIKNNLVDQKFDPAIVIGTKNKPGILFKTLWGEHKFVRPCMECIEEKKNGYDYLKSDIYVSGWQRFWIVFVATLLSGTMWAVFLFFDDKLSGRWR